MLIVNTQFLLGENNESSWWSIRIMVALLTPFLRILFMLPPP